MENVTRSPFVPTKRQYELLNALYSGMVVLHKYHIPEYEKTDMRKKFAAYAKELDELEVPFAVQNSVAMAGEKSENWDRYNRTVLAEVFAKGFSPQTVYQK